jgi:nucleoside-diphosphate-sugar epimerase
MRVVVTGGAGFVGTAVRRRFERAGADVVGMGPNPRDGIVPGDVLSYESCRAVFEGASVVVHAAARVTDAGARELFERVNVEGTRTVLRAARDAGVARVVHVSSVSVHGKGGWTGDAPEDDPVRPSGNPYTDTKIAAEHQALLAAAAGLGVVVIRPGDIYGPGSQQWTLRPAQTMARGQFALIGGGRGHLSPSYIDDVAEGIEAAATTPGVEGGIFHICGAGVTAREYFGRYADLLGITMRSVPRGLALVGGGAFSALGGLPARLGWEPPLTLRTFEYLEHPGGFSTARATEQLGWRPRTSLDDGIAESAVWLREQGLPIRAS